MDIKQLEEQLTLWHEAKFGVKELEDRAEYFEKLCEELTELCDAYLDGESPDRIAEECVDMIFVLCHIIRVHGVDLSEAIDKKLKIIFQRLEQ